MLHLADAELRTPVSADAAPVGLTYSNAGGQRFRTSIRGRWTAHDFSRFISGVNVVYRLIAVMQVAVPRLYRGGRATETRQDIYDGARLYYYLYRDEELQVSRATFASPGEMEFFSTLAASAPQIIKDSLWILALAALVPRFVRTLPSLYRHWVQEVAAANATRRNEQLQSELHRFFVGRLRDLERSQLPDTVRADASAAFGRMRDAILKLHEVTLANPIALTGHIFDALSDIARLVQAGKASLPRPPDEAQTAQPRGGDR
jgi:hypothetical protein